MTDKIDRLRRHPDAAWRKIDEQVVVVTPDDGKLHLLNDLASFLWEQLDAAQSIDALVRAVTDEYDVDENTARTDILDFFRDLISKNLLQED